MYLLIGCLLAIALVFFVFFRCRKKKACKRICGMTCEEKCDVLRPVIEPFGYCYEPTQDVFSTTIDAPQRVFGYTELFDRFAPRFNMVFDCLPIYFDYDGCTWLIEFWKGQYGINLGCEVGIYKADSLIASVLQKTALFHSVEDSEMLPISICLYQNNVKISNLYNRHWWLTAFHPGRYGEPKDLSVEICITFPNSEMLSAFKDALDAQENIEYRVCGLHIHVLFCQCSSCKLPKHRRIICRFSQWQNRIFCRLFCTVTKPFHCSLDRILLLYFCLPPVFRRIFRGRKRWKCRQKSCRKR